MAMQSGKEASASSERLWREQFAQLVSAEEIRSLSEQSLPDTFAAIGVLWVEVADPAWPPPTSFLVCPWPGRSRRASCWSSDGIEDECLRVILHEGSHGLLAKSRTLNDRICNWGIAFWTINSVEEYRPTHRLHHRYLGQETGSGPSLLSGAVSAWCADRSPPSGSSRGYGIPQGHHSDLGHLRASQEHRPACWPGRSCCSASSSRSWWSSVSSSCFRESGGGSCSTWSSGWCRSSACIR